VVITHPDYQEHDAHNFGQTEYLTARQFWLFAEQIPATGNGGTGVGDSGGPTFWIADDGTPVLVTPTCRGNPNCVSSNIAWRVDIPEMLDLSKIGYRMSCRANYCARTTCGEHLSAEGARHIRCPWLPFVDGAA
jgi:hypothetical protein